MYYVIYANALFFKKFLQFYKLHIFNVFIHAKLYNLREILTRNK